ncbi:restriction endonuclease [Novacetimonas hansenii]|uniref:restriction endonuclease n=1 Tax=Novacetimonas hansenii TaxID=436 RepID=UPI0009BDEA3C|nr:restriction endonuclease [Novacetimonas hansenii]WEQ58380.1 restriction endonuclease [Novacetimonas hansenii]
MDYIHGLMEGKMRPKLILISSFIIFSNVSYIKCGYAASTLPASGQVDWQITDTAIGEAPIIYSDQSGLKFGISASRSHLVHIDVTDNAHKISSGSWKIGDYTLPLVPDPDEAGHFGADVPAAETKAFVHNFTAAASSTIQLSDGTTPHISLAGSSVAIDAFNKYVDTHGVLLPLPFAQPHISTTEPPTEDVAAPMTSPASAALPLSFNSTQKDDNHSGLSSFWRVVIAVALAFAGVKIFQEISRHKRKRQEREAIDADNARTAHGLQLCIREIKAKEKILAMKWRQNIYQDDYGTIITKKWEPEIPIFLNSRIVPILQQNNLLDKWEIIRSEVIAEINRTASKTIPDIIPTEPVTSGPEIFSPTMNPYDYEEHCAILLRQIGWNARATVASGDQGADVIADKDGKKIVLQCKLYSNPVGNDAVQQAFSAMGYYDCTHSAVVSNAGFTTSARQLASKNGVTLLNHAQLQDYARDVEIEDGDRYGT